MKQRERERGRGREKGCGMGVEHNQKITIRSSQTRTGLDPRFNESSSSGQCGPQSMTDVTTEQAILTDTETRDVEG